MSKMISKKTIRRGVKNVKNNVLFLYGRLMTEDKARRLLQVT